MRRLLLFLILTAVLAFYGYAVCAAWSVPVNISRTADVSNTFIAVDGTGRLHVAYTRSQGLFAVTIVNDVRSPEVSFGTGVGPSIAADSQGRAHLVYSEGWEIRYRQWSNGSWDPTVYTLSNGTGDCLRPDVCVDSAGNVHVVWTKGSNVWYNRRSAATNQWDGPQQITFTNDLQGYFPPRLACLGTAPVFLWGRTIGSQWMAQFTSKESGSWITTDISAGQTGSAGDIDITPSDDIICAWDGNYDIWCRIRSGGTWGALTQIRGGGASSLTPRVSCATSSKADIVWLENGDVYGSRWNGSSWGPAASLTNFTSTGAVSPGIAHDPSGYQYIVYGNSWDGWLLSDAPDNNPPPAVSNVTKIETDRQVQLSWTNPTAIDLSVVRIVYRTDRFPTNPSDGTLALTRLVSGFGADSFTHTGLTNGTTYYYAIFVSDEVPNYSPAATISATPSGPPKTNMLTNGAISSFSGATASGWQSYRVSDPAGAIIFGSDSGYYMSSPSQVISGIDSTSLPASGLSAAGLYQVISGVTPGKIYQFVGYQDLSNTGGTTAGHRYLHNFGINTSGGTNPGGLVTDGTIGGCKWMTSSQALWNDTPGPGGSQVYGGFNRAMAAYPATSSSISVWTGLTINNPGTRDSSAMKFNMDQFYLFEWDLVSNFGLVNGGFEGNKIDLQNGGDVIPAGWVPCGGMIAPDGYAYLLCDSLAARTGANGVRLWNRRGTTNAGLMQKLACLPNASCTFTAWGKSTGQDSASISIGIDPYGGGDITSSNIVWQTTTATDWTLLTVTTTSRANAVTVFIRTTSTNSAAGGYHWGYFDDTTFTGPSLVKSITAAKSLADGTPVTINEGVVTAVFNGSFYIERPDRSSGIKVKSSTAVTLGDTVSVSGHMATANGERCIVGS